MMRHRIVTGIVFSLAGIFVAAVVIFASGMTRPVAPRTDGPAQMAGPTGEALFSRHCAMCHVAEDTGISYRDAADRDAAVAELRELLADHYGPSPEGIALIVSHVMTMRSTPDSGN